MFNTVLFIQDAKRTEADLSAGLNISNEMARQLHAAIGLSTEAGELTDAFKKALFYGKPLDRVNVIEEAGDLLWYLALLFDSLGSSFEEAAEKVIAKLRARYPEKFSGELAINRDLVNERAVLEGTVVPTQLALDVPEKERASRPRITPAERQRISALVLSGLRDVDIAAETGRSPAAVGRIRQELRDKGFLND